MHAVFPSTLYWIATDSGDSSQQDELATAHSQQVESYI